MKRASLLLVAAIYALTCVGVTFQFHVCQNKIVSLAVQQRLQDQDRCCNKPDKDNDCCKDVTKVVKLEQAGLKFVTLKLVQPVPLDLPAIVFPVYEFALCAFASVVTTDHPPPPLLSSLPRHLALGIILV